MDYPSIILKRIHNFVFAVKASDIFIGKLCDFRTAFDGNLRIL